MNSEILEISSSNIYLLLIDIYIFNKKLIHLIQFVLLQKILILSILI